MRKSYRFYAPALLACAANAQAADSSLTLTSRHTDYTKDFGMRRDTNVESTTDLGATAFTLGVSQGRRKFEGQSFSATRLSATVFHDWSSRVYTRTSVGASSGKPVYASREVSNDINFKLLPALVATVGGKYARYHDARDVRSWSAGGTWYFGGGLATYRYSAYDVERLGKSHGHLATLRVKDGKGAGATQMWLGMGSSLHEQEETLSGSRGRFKSAVLQRVQPIEGPLAATVSLGRSWYDTDAAKYRGATASIGLQVRGWPKL